MAEPGRLTADAVLEFILAGNARFTVRDSHTGTRYTYRVKLLEKEKMRVKRYQTVHFVSVLTGPDNVLDYTWLGTVFDGAEYYHGRYSEIGPNAKSVRLFQWLFGVLASGAQLPERLEIWHEGRCGRCGRVLTVPESVERGIGPECAKHVGG